MVSSKPEKNMGPSPKQMILGYFTVLAIMLMLFGILLLPSTHVISHEKGLIEEVTEDVKTSTYTPFVNNEFIFYWSPIDPLYDQADTEQQCPWGIENGVNDDNNNGQTDDEERRGISFYGDSYISDEGAIAIGSYDDKNRITVTLLKGHRFTQRFMNEYPENTIHSCDGEVYLADENNNGKPDRDPTCEKINLHDPARAPLNSPDLVKVENVVLYQGVLNKYRGMIHYTTRDWRLWDGTIKVESTGRVTVQKMTVTDGYIDKNGNGIPDLEDDVDPDDNNGDYEVAHGVDTAWFANGMSDDAIWSFYGDEFFGFVHRDLMIASYDDDNHITIIDKSDGDDTQEVTLDVWENFQWASTFVEETWCGGDDAGDNNELDYNHNFDIDWSDLSAAREAMGSDLVKRATDSGNFEADWVVVKSDKPVTIYGGLWDNNFHTQAYGFLGSRYYVPMSAAITITGLEREAHVELDFDDTSEGDDEFSVKPGEQVTICSMSPRPFSNNYVAEVQWVRIVSDWPIRVELWMANDDNAFDETQISTFEEGYDYYPAQEKWDLAIHHRCLIYIIALENDTFVGWDGTWLDNQPSGAELDEYEIYRIVVDSNEDYNGDERDDTEPDNQDELESVIQMIHVHADKDVMLEVRYARDFSCEPQDMDIVLSNKPTFQRTTTGDPFWLLPPILSILLATDIGIVTMGGKGIVGTLSFTGKSKFMKSLAK
ncbi:MAG: hypothetical protein JSV56_12470 [Methanomassiliicoccales archaeon]|nr:MAG: hypothetical protein JSV56_12470 [Methanomassiliicoccales archaeon]